MIDFLSYDYNQGHHHAEQRHQQDIFNEEFGRILIHREREIIKNRYYLDGYDELTLEEAGFRFDVTRERVRPFENKAMHKLHLKGKNLKGLL